MVVARDSTIDDLAGQIATGEADLAAATSPTNCKGYVYGGLLIPNV